MCLKTVDFALRYDKTEQAFIGYGFKKVDYSMLRKLQSGEWLEATGRRNCVNAAKIKLETKRPIKASDGNNYLAGFHTFTKEKHAREYNATSPYVVKVMYKDVIGFGINKSGYRALNGPTVISKYIKLVGTL